MFGLQKEKDFLLLLLRYGHKMFSLYINQV